MLSSGFFCQIQRMNVMSTHKPVVGLARKLLDIHFQNTLFWGNQLFKDRSLSREQIFTLMSDALRTGTGFALAKLGVTETKGLIWNLLNIQQSRNCQLLHVESGVFPADKKYMSSWMDAYRDRSQELDIAAFPLTLETWLLSKQLWPSQHVCHPRLTEPFGLCPQRHLQDPDIGKDWCYTKLFANKRILIINPIASFLASRATKSIFEDVWQDRAFWWEPAEVLAFDIPNGIAPETRKEFGNSHNLFKHISEGLHQRSAQFDIALIGAGSYGIPIASEIKRLNKIAIVMGGHLQMVFGVYGNRWLALPNWQSIINNQWVRPPERYRPSTYLFQDNGCYW